MFLVLLSWIRWSMVVMESRSEGRRVLFVVMEVGSEEGGSLRWSDPWKWSLRVYLRPNHTVMRHLLNLRSSPYAAVGIASYPLIPNGIKSSLCARIFRLLTLWVG